MPEALSQFGPLILFGLPLIIVFVLLNRTAKKQRAQAEQQRNEALQVGTWVVTRGGFYGRIAEIDGDVIVLENHLGDETLWDRQAVVMAKNPPVEEDSVLLTYNSKPDEDAEQETLDNLEAGSSAPLVKDEQGE